MHSSTFLFALSLSLLAAATPAHAAFHLMKVVEVFAGTPAAPDARYVVLQMYSTGQNFVGGHSVQVFDSANTSIGTFTFPGSVANGTNQAKLLIATLEASEFFGVAADLTMTPVIAASGGMVCFDTIDCVAWGAYTGPDTGVGTPFGTGTGIPPNQAIVRRLDIAGSPTLLESGDDTDDSANDFRSGSPAPRNNAGATGTVPPSTCGNGVIEGLEECDDNNTDDGDGCSSTCAVEATTGTGETPAVASWLQATPNPSRGDVALQFALAAPGRVDLGVYDLAGRRIRDLGTSLPEGPQRVLWDGRDDSGRRAPAAFYIVRVRSGTFTASTRLVRLP